MVSNGNDGQLKFRSAPDYETPLGGLSDDSNSYSLTITAIDSEGFKDEINEVLSVSDIEEHYPRLNYEAKTTINIEENKTDVASFIHFDKDLNDKITYEIEGADSSLFSIDINTGNLSFKESPDYEDPKSSKLSNEYTLTVKATDLENRVVTSDLTINVLDKYEFQPVIEQIQIPFSNEVDEHGNIYIPENSFEIATYNVTDEDVDDTVSWSLSGEDASFFEISFEGLLSFKSSPDYENPQGGSSEDSNLYNITLLAEDSKD